MKLIFIEQDIKDKIHEEAKEFRNKKLMECYKKEIYGKNVEFEKYIINRWREHYDRNFI